MPRATVTPPRDMFSGECRSPSLGQRACRVLCRRGQRTGVRRETSIGLLRVLTLVRLRVHPPALCTGQIGTSTLSGLIGAVPPLQVPTPMPSAQAPWPCRTKQRHIANACYYCKARVMIAKPVLLFQSPCCDCKLSWTIQCTQEIRITRWLQ